MIAVELSRQNELNADPRAIQQINFTANLDRAGNTAIFLIIDEAKETIFAGYCKSFVITVLLRFLVFKYIK